MSRALISVQSLCRRFREPAGRGALTVFENLWFDVAEGEFVCMIGHSGCGKSTILNILAGLDMPTDGHIIVNGRHIQGPSLDRAVIFQGHALMPWMSALGNIELAVSSRHRRWHKKQIRAHAMRYLDLVHLSDAGHKKPSQLSGGMRQRVGIARALAIEPKVLLMDEPFSALDALTRGSLQDEVVSIHATARRTTFMITHDVDEAMLLADKILLMTNGPNARVAEIVENTLPKNRARVDLHKHANYYALRNHLIDFLVTRSRELAGGTQAFDPRHPPVVRPALKETTRTLTTDLSQLSPAPAHTPCRSSSAIEPLALEAIALRPAASDLFQSCQVVPVRDSHHRNHPTKGALPMRREQLTEKILDIKREKGLSWKHITDEIGGMSPVLVVGALLGQMKLVKPLARKAASLFGLSENEERMLNEVPLRGTAMPPTDPLIYRFYELVMVNGPAWKALIEEEFGDGIMSAIDFDISIDRQAHPKGDRVKITMSGKFLPFKYYGNEQGIPEYGLKE
jgi:nitrate/nitrite transport system ATP-binding protein